MLDKGRKGESDKYVLDFPIVVCKPLNWYHFDGKTFESSSECFFGLEVNRTVRKRKLFLAIWEFRWSRNE